MSLHKTFATQRTVTVAAGQRVIASDVPQLAISQPPDPADPDHPGIRLDIGEAADVAVDDNFIIPDRTRPILFTGDVQWTSCRPVHGEVNCEDVEMN